ncbi:uncharacterized protein LOC132181891 [Corylus avellana]|uniref:uncharacterized protein LOC132181891 n=1 Tax=Corylus avellana TaxID=13451 RepID=UPI002869ED57|nr:uncharacterized protein LOC132181891 [Corylus avellana]
MTLQLANRSVKIPRVIIEDVLIKVDKFYFPVDFIMLDTEPVQNVGIQIPRCMINIFFDMVERFLEIFMDDFSVFGSSFEECLHRLTLVLVRCKKNLVLNLEKCHFMVKQHVVSHRGIEVDKAKDFSKITKPLCKLLVKETPFVFDEDYKKAFGDLNRILTSTPIIQPPNWGVPFKIMCDASDYAVGAILGKHVDKLPHVIYYASRTLNDAQLNYSTIEKELLEFDIEIRDKKASENVVVDQLSRLTMDFTEDAIPISETFPNEPLMHITHNLAPWFADIVNYLATGQMPLHWGQQSCHPISPINEWTNGDFKSRDQKNFGKDCESYKNDWSLRLNDALWAYRIAFKTPIGMSPYCLVYGKACHLLVELEHRAQWAIKQLSFNLTKVGSQRKLQLNELEELRNDAYDCARLYQAQMKKAHAHSILRRSFQPSQKVLLYNSRLHLFLGKLKSRCIGPFIIRSVFTHGAIETKDPKNGNTFKVNGQRLKPFLELKSPKIETTLLEDPSYLE